MATITKVGTPSLATTTQDPGPHQAKGRAATALAAGDVVYLNDVSGVPTLTKANGTSANAAALYVGVMPKAAVAGEKAVAYHGVEMNYGSGMTCGARVYVSATAGAIDDGATTGGTVPIGYVSSPTTIFFFTPGR